MGGWHRVPWVPRRHGITRRVGPVTSYARSASSYGLTTWHTRQAEHAYKPRVVLRTVHKVGDSPNKQTDWHTYGMNKVLCIENRGKNRPKIGLEHTYGVNKDLCNWPLAEQCPCDWQLAVNVRHVMCVITLRLGRRPWEYLIYAKNTPNILCINLLAGWKQVCFHKSLCNIARVP